MYKVKNVRFIKSSLLFSLILGLSSCFGLFDSGSDEIIGKYKVVWIDLKENQIICEESQSNSSSCIQIIPEYVFAVGHNSNFIIAKQHPTSGFENGYKIDTSITNYYLINIKITDNRRKVMGPLSEDEFSQTRKMLGIDFIEFDMIYPESY